MVGVVCRRQAAVAKVAGGRAVAGGGGAGREALCQTAGAPAVLREGSGGAAEVQRAVTHGGGSWPALRFDCGLDDALLEENRAFHDHLERVGVEHSYVEFPGGHDWDYNDARLGEALEFHWEILGRSLA